MYPSRLHGFGGIGIKGHEVLLRAAPQILRSTPGTQLFVVGDEMSGSGEYRRGLEASAIALGLAGHVHFIGHRTDITSVLAGLDVVVNPSMEESACYTMVEALLMERGVVASNVGGLPDTVQHGETGLLVPPGDPAALAAAVTELLADPGRRREMGRLGRARCLRQFDIAVTVAKLETLYRNTLEPAAAGQARRMKAAAMIGSPAPARPGRGLRILQVTATSVGGAWFYDQVTGLTRLGHSVLAVLPGAGPLHDRLRAAGIPVEIIPFQGKRLGQLPRVTVAELRLLRLVRAFRPDVIHAHLLKAVMSCRLAALGYSSALRVSQLPGTVHLHSPLLRWLDCSTLSRDDVVIGSCQAIADRYRAMGARTVAVSYYGCDVRRIDPHVSGTGFRREFGLADGTPTVGMIAHMYATRMRAFRGTGVKGHEVFLDAVPLILRRVPDARLFVVGDELAGDGGYRRALEDRGAALGVAGNLRFIGHRTDITSVLAGLDVVVNPSMEESASYAMVEALLMERGVVASNVGGLPDTVQHGETGLLVPPGDPAALAAAVTELLADPGRRREMGRLGRARCLRQFDISRHRGQCGGRLPSGAP